MKLKVAYEVDGEPKDITVEYTLADLMAWEETTGLSAMDGKDTISQLTWLAHHAAVRKGLINGDLKAFADFQKVCTDIESVRADPTKAEGSAKATRKRASDSSSAG